MTTLSAAVESHSFWTFQAKDLITAIIAIVGMIIAITNVYNAYLRRANVAVAFGRWLYIASHQGRADQIRLFLNCIFINSGAEPALVVNLAVILSRDDASSPPTDFFWREFVSRKEVRDSGALHHKGIRAEYQGEAFALVVPKTGSENKEIVFSPIDGGREFKPGLYRLRVEGQLQEHARSTRQFRSKEVIVRIDAQTLKEVANRVVRDEEGKYQYSNHVRIRTESTR